MRPDQGQKYSKLMIDTRENSGFVRRYLTRNNSLRMRGGCERAYDELCEFQSA